MFKENVLFVRFKQAAVGGIARLIQRRLPAWSAAAPIVLLAGMCMSATAWAAPAITNISPTTVSAGGPNFVLTVNGSGYVAGSTVVQINGNSRQTVFVSTAQLTATVLASDIKAPGALTVTVLVSSSGVAVSSNPAQIAVVSAASPVLTSASPGSITQGVEQVSMTLVGANFRPGATVVISPPLATLSASDGHTQAGDVSVLNATVVNSGVMTALISMSPMAAQGLRAVDVLNLDGTSTIDATTTSPQGSTQPVRMSPANSIGSPLSVLNMAMMQPRDGTVVMQGDELNAEAVLAGTGTGTVIGQWVWDGSVVEQFSATIVGGASTVIETRQSLPTWLLGAHTLELRMLQPNQVASKLIEVVVNPGNWKMEQLIQPESGAVFDVNEMPHLLWAIVPGAMRYQVGFSSQPYLSTIDKWFDVEENQWQVPATVWQSLPEGELYWTVRTVDVSASPRKPLPMRVLYRRRSLALSSLPPMGASQASGRTIRVNAQIYPLRADGHVIPFRANYLRADYVTANADAPPATAAPAKGVTDAEAPKAAGATAKKRVGPAEDGQIGMTTQWASGSNPPDSNALTVAEHMTYQQGPWHFEVNGSGLLNSILNPEAKRTSHGAVNNYVIQLTDQEKAWGANLRFGIVTPTLYTDAQFVSAATPRQGAELALKTPGGTFSGFTNTNDEVPGGGSSINVHQQIEGASWQARLPQWMQLRLMWLNVTDVGVTSGPSASGDVYGGLMNIQLSKQWKWTSEYAVSHDNLNTAVATSTREFGRAWRTGITGQRGKTTASVAYHDESSNFGNPANPGLTPSSTPNVRGVNGAITQATKKAGTFGLNYTLLQNNVRPTTSDELLLNTFEETWSKPLDKKTNLSLDVRQSLTETGTVPAALISMAPAATGAQDMRDLSGSINLSHKVGSTTLTLGGQRDWLHNTLFPANSTITSSLNAGANLVTKGHFQLNTQASVNWMAANGLTAGDSRNVSVNVQPTLAWKKPAVQLSPLITVAQGETRLASGTLTSDTLTGQYGGRATWTLPGRMKFSTLSAQGSYNQNRNTVTGLNQPTTQLLALWTANWSHKHTFK
ncbi:MAG: IPT/TIG domain-containing protein [Terracidiphilus sp.]